MIYLALREQKKVCPDFYKAVRLTMDPQVSFEVRLLAHGCWR